MPDQHFRLFTRIMSRNREVYLLKIMTLAIAFASSVLIILFSLNEFGFDRFHRNANTVFRVLQKNTDPQYSGNRLSVTIPAEIFKKLKSASYKDSLLLSRIKVMNNVSVTVLDASFHDQTIHAVDSNIGDIFTLDILNGNIENFRKSKEARIMLSSRAAQKYTGSLQAAGKKIKLHTLNDSIEVSIAAVFNNFPKNSHEDFDVFLAFNTNALTALNFDPEETGVYGRMLKGKPGLSTLSPESNTITTKMVYFMQPLPELYFGPRPLGDEARHGDRYSVIILICIACLIFFLSLSSFINLTTITLPYRSKELAIKKLSGTSQVSLLYVFFKESSALVGISLLTGLILLRTTSNFIESLLDFQILSLILQFDPALILIVAVLFVILSASPVLMTIRFVQAAPNRLLRTDTITFPRFKRVITFLQLGISIFLIIASVVIRRQINYSLVKEPGNNHDQVVYLNFPAGMTNEEIMTLRSDWKKTNPNILDVMAVSQLPDRILSKEIDSEFYLLQVDPGFREFFDLTMLEGYWFGPNPDDSSIVVTVIGKERIGSDEANVIGVVEDPGGLFNQPAKPVKIKLASDNNYNWLCVRLLEVDIRKTVKQLSHQFSFQGKPAAVNYLDRHFKSWINYQDRLNQLSGILTIVSGILSCFAIYGLSVSLVRDKLKEIAVHKLLGASTYNITYLLAQEFLKQMIIALAIFGPLTYLLLHELLRTFVFSTKFLWLDPLYPVAYCVFVIIIVCGFQAMSLNRTDFASALKG